MEVPRKLQAVGPRIESRSEIHDGIEAFIHGPEDGTIEKKSPYRPRPIARGRHVPENLLAACTGELTRERVAKQGIGALRFDGTVNRGPASGVGDVADRRRLAQEYLTAPPILRRNALDAHGDLRRVAEGIFHARVAAAVALVGQRLVRRPGNMSHISLGGGSFSSHVTG